MRCLLQRHHVVQISGKFLAQVFARQPEGHCRLQEPGFRPAIIALTAKAEDIVNALRVRIPGLGKINLRSAERTSAGPSRMSHDTIRSDAMASFRKRDPLLRAAIDELDLSLID